MTTLPPKLDKPPAAAESLDTVVGDGPPPSLNSETMAKSLKGIQLWKADNTSTTLGEALAGTQRQKVLVILVRHFYCLSCQGYIRQMSKLQPPAPKQQSAASAAAVSGGGGGGKPPTQDDSDGTSIIVIGCGFPSLIQWYIKVTNCPYPVYADPETRLYQLLGTNRAPPVYAQYPLSIDYVRAVLQSIKMIVKGDMKRTGDMRVNGGEFLFWRGGSGATTTSTATTATSTTAGGNGWGEKKKINLGLLGQQRPPPKRLSRRRMNSSLAQEKEDHDDDNSSSSYYYNYYEDEEDEEYDLWGERKTQQPDLTAAHLETDIGNDNNSKDLYHPTGVQVQSDWKIRWYHLMTNIKDHTQIDQLKKMTGLTSTAN